MPPAMPSSVVREAVQPKAGPGEEAVNDFADEVDLFGESLFA